MAEEGSCNSETVLLVATISAFIASEMIGWLPIPQTGIIHALMTFFTTLPEYCRLPEFDVKEPLAFSVV